MPFIPPPIAGVLSVIQSAKRNVEKRKGDDDVAPVAGAERKGDDDALLRWVS